METRPVGALVKDGQRDQAFVFHHTPIRVLLAVLFADLRAQKHSGQRVYTIIGRAEEGGFSLQSLLRKEVEAVSLGKSSATTPKIVETKVESVKSAYRLSEKT